MKYEAWTAKAVELRVLEMADTLRLMPSVKGPKAFGNGMPEPVRERMEAYGSSPARYRQAASAGALSRMEECFGWINELGTQADRKLLYAWAWVKVRRGQTLSAFAAENELNDRMLRREITRICQTLSDGLNRKAAVRLSLPYCTLSEIEAKTASTKVTSEKCAKHWRAEDAKPQIDPALPPQRLLDHRDIRAR